MFGRERDKKYDQKLNSYLHLFENIFARLHYMFLAQFLCLPKTQTDILQVALSDWKMNGSRCGIYFLSEELLIIYNNRQQKNFEKFLFFIFLLTVVYA